LSTYLLDVNVLIALVDPAHVQHDPAHDWFERTGHRSWATCPITENGLVRIVGHPRYPSSPGTPADVADILLGMRELPGHKFWPDDISLVSSNLIDTGRLLNHGQITDCYLLALAGEHGGKLASFDARIVVDAVNGGEELLHLI
jgi:toxin-antitoxin system PIN domain toxin